jgi:hypothetical protein
MNGPKSVTASFVPFTGCAYSLSRTGFSALTDGDIGRVDVSVTDGCTWTSSSNASWILVTSGFTGSGNGTIRFNVSPNPSSSLRMGAITIGGQTFTIGQAGSGCIPGIWLATQGSVQPGGGPFSLNISAPSGCEWYAAPAPSWLTLNTSTSGNGTAAAQLAASGNFAPSPRTGSVSIGGIVSQFVQPAAVSTQIFTDVPATHPYADHIALLHLYGVTSGCSPAEYCPDAPITRGQMAVFIIRSLMGNDNFQAQITPYFTDVPATHPYFKHIQKMRELGITTGCTATQYCPDDPVTRGQVGVFLIRARLGLPAGQTFPYPAISYFQDVSSSHSYFSYIQKMRQLGITSGCTSAAYCSDAPTTRGQMAAFLIRAFFTP